MGKFPASTESAVFQNPAFLAFPVTITLSGTFIVTLLTLGETDFELDPIVFPVHGQRDNGVTLAVGGADQMGDLAPVEQQLAGPGRIGVDVGGGRLQGRDQRTQEERLGVFDQHIAIAQLDTPSPDRLDLPPLQRHAGLVGVFDKVVVAGLFIEGDGAAAVFSVFFRVLGHSGQL